MKIKKIFTKSLKGIWLTIGALIILWTFFWFIKMITIKSLGVIAVAAIFGAGIYMFFIYLFLTGLYFLIKWIIRMIKNHKKK